MRTGSSLVWPRPSYNLCPSTTLRRGRSYHLKHANHALAIVICAAVLTIMLIMNWIESPRAAKGGKSSFANRTISHRSTPPHTPSDIDPPAQRREECEISRVGSCFCFIQLSILNYSVSTVFKLQLHPLPLASPSLSRAVSGRDLPALAL